MKLNSTGSFTVQGNTFYSYDTKLTEHYKGYRIYNATRYSATTAKHQAVVRSRFVWDIELHHCEYGDWDPAKMIQNEIRHIEWDLKDLEGKRNTQKKKDTVKELTETKARLEEILGE